MDNSRATDPDFVNCSVAIQSPAEAGKATKRPRRRAVSEMTAAELERKRAFDRNSQKASRARRLAYIHELEVELELLQSLPSSENHDGENVVQKLSQRNQQLETEITRLRLAYGFSRPVHESQTVAGRASVRQPQHECAATAVGCFPAKNRYLNGHGAYSMYTSTGILSQVSCVRCARLGPICVCPNTNRVQCQNRAQSNSYYTPACSPSPTLRSEIAGIAENLIQILQIDDPRFCVAGIGGFVADIPRRLGTNEALDAGVKAFSAVMLAVRTGRPKTSMFAEYGRALSVLRKLSVTPKKVETVETLCAMYLLSICQDFIGGSWADFSAHCKGILHILNSDAAREWNDDFSRQLLGIASLIAISETVPNRNSQFKPKFLPIRKLGPCPAPRRVNIVSPDAFKVENLVNFSKYFHEPEMHLSDIRERYEHARHESHILLNSVANILAGQPATVLFTSNLTTIRTYILCAGSAGLVMTIAMILNQILRIFNPSDSLLQQDITYLTSEVISLAEGAKCHGPVGSLFVPIMLCVAAATTSCEKTNEKLAELIEPNQVVYRGAKSSDIILWLRRRFAGMRKRATMLERRENPLGIVHHTRVEQLGELSLDEDEELFQASETTSCCVL